MLEMCKKQAKAQSMVEYALLITLVLTALVGIQVYLKRAIGGKFKDTADSIGEQFTTNPNGPYTISTTQTSQRRERVNTGGDYWMHSETLQPELTTREIKNFNSGDLKNIKPLED